MKKSRRAFLRLAAAGSLLGGLGSGRAQSARVIKFSHVVAPDTPKGQGALVFKQLVEARSGGKIVVEIYPNSTLYKDKEEMEALQIGAVQMLAPSLSKFGPLGVRQFELFDLPYLFPDEAAFQKVTQGPIGVGLFSLLESKAIKGLAFWSAGFHVYSANRPLRVPGDLKGLKMRVASSKVLEASVRTLGALPQVLPFSDVYSALQTGVVDGTENVPSSYTSQKWYEVQKHIALTYHTHTGYAAIMNKKFWDELPADLKVIVSAAVTEASRREAQLVATENVKALDMMRNSGKTQIQDLTDAERGQWRSALLPVHREMESRIGKELIDSVYRATGTTATT
ncbi:MAG: DctP family TRAP transporter solute-binding subunit [Burkholderiaceae bacterium]|jgi:C4-dicarboxylate-binding protein DctP